MEANELTRRQWEVLDLLGEGKGATEISRILKISRAGVYQHIDKLKEKGVLDQDYTPVMYQPGEIKREVQPDVVLVAALKETREDLHRIITRIDQLVGSKAD